MEDSEGEVLLEVSDFHASANLDLTEVGWANPDALDPLGSHELAQNATSADASSASPGSSAPPRDAEASPQDDADLVALTRR